jgi:hypothetical protein
MELKTTRIDGEPCVIITMPWQEAQEVVGDMRPTLETSAAYDQLHDLLNAAEWSDR